MPTLGLESWMWWLWVSTGWALDLSYDDALKRAVEKNPDLVIAGKDQEAAEGALIAAKGTFDPMLRGSLSYDTFTGEDIQPGVGEVLSDRQALTYGVGIYEFFPTGTTAALDWGTEREHFVYTLAGGQPEEGDPQFQPVLTASLTQSFLQGNRTAYNLAGVRSARRYTDLQDAYLEAQRQQTMGDTALAYWNLYYLNRVVEIARSTLDVSMEEQRVVQARVEAGDLAPVERSRVATIVVQAESALLQAENDAAAAEDVLLLTIGESPGEPVVLTTEPAEPIALELDEDSVVKEALQASPALQASRIAEETADLDYGDARHARLPELTGEARYSVYGREPSLAAATEELFGGELREWYLGGEVLVPLGNRADRGLYFEQQATAARARIEREALERSLDQQVRAQVRTLESARKTVSLAESNLAFAEETLAAERALQEAGRAIQKDVLESIRAVDDAKVQLAKARADYQLAVVELGRLKGTL